jgi:hypothetical protein
MLLCNYELPLALVPPLALPTPATTISPTSIIVIVLVVVIYFMPAVAAITPLASRRWAGRVSTAPVAALAEYAKEADPPSVDHCLCLRALLCLLHLDNEDGVALAVPPSAHVDYYVVNCVVTLDDACSARTLSF